MSEAIAKEIIIILKNHKEDQTHMDDINQEIEGIQKLQRARETSLEANITALSQTVEEEKKFMPLCDEGSFTPKEENVEMEISKVKKHREVVVRDLEKNMAKLEICKKVEENLIEERENVSDETAVKLPKMRYDVELYTNITGIRWHYDGEPDEIKGYISKGKNVKSFSLNTKKHSHFFITNYLWDLMEEEW